MASKNVVAASRRCVGHTAIRCRTFTSSAHCMVNPLLNLSHFSAAKEAQYLSKERKIPQTEFHPYLELIRSSEVDIFAPAPGASAMVVSALKRAQMGQTDMQTTFNLAIANAMQQIQAARNESYQARMTLARIHEKYRREERTSFLVMMTTIALLSLVLVKTDALQDLKVYAQDLNSQWKGFDWEWLGNPPSYKNPARYSSTSDSKAHPSSFVISTSNGTPIYPIEAQSDHIARSPVPPTSAPASVQVPRRWSLSRLFWAAPSEIDS